MTRPHRPKKSKKAHKRCAGPGCRNIVAKDSKKGALCGICREKLETEATEKDKGTILREEVGKENEEPTPEVKVEEPTQPSFAEKLSSLRKKVEG